MQEKRNPDVYFIQNTETKEIKIGSSVHPEIRKNELGENMRILHIIPKAGQQVEKELHRKFIYSHTHGDWFKPDKNILMFIQKLKKGQDVKLIECVPEYPSFPLKHEELLQRFINTTAENTAKDTLYFDPELYDVFREVWHQKQREFGRGFNKSHLLIEALLLHPDICEELRKQGILR